MRWKILFFLIVFSLLAAAASAGTDIALKPVKNAVSLTETASFELSLTNLAGEKQRYSLFSFVQGWDIEPFPLKDKIIEIFPNKTKVTTIRAKPTASFDPGIYRLALNIETDLGEKYTESLPVYINPDKPMDYLPSIKVTVDMEQKINPQELQTIKLLLENRNPLNMPELVIKLQSDLLEFNKETMVSLSPLEKKTVEFTLAPDPFQRPGEYFLFFTFEKDGEDVKVIPQSVEIIPLTPEFKTDFTQEEFFLKTVKKLTATNLGNVKDTQKVSLPTSLWPILFTQSSGDIIKKEGQRYFSWELTLLSNESVTLVLVQNYRYPFYFLVLLVILVAVYFYLKSPFSLSKTASSLKKDATLSELKITLHLKNVTKKPQKNLEVIDLIPGIADLEKSLDVGTLKPQEIKHSNKGTLVKWKLAEIDAKEDRLITYQVRSKLKIVGALKLPRAKIVYGDKGKKRTAYSNTFRISS